MICFEMSNQTKLTSAFAIRSRAGVQIRAVGRVKKIERINIVAEKRSTMLSRSPVKRNMLLSNRSPAQKRTTCKGSEYPNTSIKNAMDDARSIKPKILTKTIKMLS